MTTAYLIKTFSTTYCHLLTYYEGPALEGKASEIEICQWTLSQLQLEPKD